MAKKPKPTELTTSDQEKLTALVLVSGPEVMCEAARKVKRPFKRPVGRPRGKYHSNLLDLADEIEEYTANFKSDGYKNAPYRAKRAAFRRGFAPEDQTPEAWKWFDGHAKKALALKRKQDFYDPHRRDAEIARRQKRKKTAP